MHMSSPSFHTNIYLVSNGFAYTTGGDISLPGSDERQVKACLMLPSLDHELKGFSVYLRLFPFSALPQDLRKFSLNSEATLSLQRILT